MSKSSRAAKLSLAVATGAGVSMSSLAIAFGWAMHALPDSANVLLFALGGMAVFGGFVSFFVSAVANILLRAGPPRLRWLTFAAWPGACGAGYVWLVNAGGDPWRSAAVAAIAGLCGLTVGPFYAELVVGSWFYERKKRALDAELARKLSESKVELSHKLSETKREYDSKLEGLKAAQEARRNAQERSIAIRNYFRR